MADTVEGSSAVPLDDRNEIDNNSRLSHTEMKEVFCKAIEELFDRDPILNDLNSDITEQEVSGVDVVLNIINNINTV